MNQNRKSIEILCNYELAHKNINPSILVTSYLNNNHFLNNLVLFDLADEPIKNNENFSSN